MVQGPTLPFPGARAFPVYGPDFGSSPTGRPSYGAGPTGLGPEAMFLQDLFVGSGSGGLGAGWMAPSFLLQSLLVHELLQMLVAWFAQSFAQGQVGRDLGNLNAGAGGGGANGATNGGGAGSPSSGSGAGGASSPSSSAPSAVPSNLPTGRGTVGDFLAAALAQKGDRYRFGAETRLDDPNPDTFDCSELVQWAAHQAGVTIADGSWNQKAACKPISVEEALRTPGALLFKPGHVAISLGDGRTIEAMGTKWGVVVANGRGRFTSGGLIPGMQYG